MDRPLSPLAGVKFRLLALDIDGTLLRSDRAISSRTRAALDAARNVGVRLVLVTGRRYPAARRVAQDLGGEVPLILHNGALIMMEAGTPLRCQPLARDAALRVIDVGREAGADPVVHCGLRGEGRLLVEGVSPRNALLTYYLDRSSSDVVMVPDLARALQEDPLQVMFGGPMTEVEGLRPRVESCLGASVRTFWTVYPRNGVGILDVVAPRVSKAEALSFLRERWGLTSAETLAIGDNWNDREMLEGAGLGFIMGNADPEMLRLGLPVLPTNDEDGVAVAIETHILAG